MAAQVSERFGTLANEQLARAMGALEANEKELASAREEIQLLKEVDRSASARIKDLEKRVVKLEETNKELMHVNHQWDLEYREQGEAFRRYRFDSQQAQSEYLELIAKLKADKDQLQEEIKTVKYEHGRQRRVQGGGSAEVHSLQRKLKEKEEEIDLLQQQLKTYQEDFEAERRDRERINEEKQSAVLRFEAEITSLKLQLDRCRNELTYANTEATRLAQQLRLKIQHEEDQFKKHLESKGFVARGSNGGLPRLDPFVEIDKNGYHKKPTGTSQSGSELLYPVGMNGHDPALQQAHWQTGRNGRSANASPVHRRERLAPPSGMISRGVETTSAPPSMEHHASPSPPPVRNPSPVNLHTANGPPPVRNPSPVNLHPANGPPPVRNHSPVNANAPPPVRNPSPVNLRSADWRIVNPARIVEDSGVILANGHVVDPVAPRLPPRPAGMTNGYGFSPPSPPLVDRTIQYPPSDARSSNSSQQRRNQEPLLSQLSRLNAVDPTFANPDVSHIPPMESKGKYACPRCGRRFNKRNECEDHKVRCLI